MAITCGVGAVNRFLALTSLQVQLRQLQQLAAAQQVAAQGYHQQPVAGGGFDLAQLRGGGGSSGVLGPMAGLQQQGYPGDLRAASSLPGQMSAMNRCASS